MKNAYIIDAIRTPFGRYAGGLAPVRADDLGAVPLKALMERNPSVDWNVVDDVLFGCANQAGEDNRNVGRMSALLAGIPYTVPATTVNRLCGSSLDTVAMAARAIKAGEADVIVAGGVESMSRAPFVMGKSESAFGRSQKIEDTTMGWRFINPKLKEMYGVETMPQTAENVAEQFNICTGSSIGCIRCAFGDDCSQPTRGNWWQICIVLYVYRCGSRHRFNY